MIKKIVIYISVILFMGVSILYADDYIMTTEKNILTLNKRIMDIQMEYKRNGERVPPWEEAKIVEIRYDIDMMKFSIRLKQRNLLPKKYEMDVIGGYPELQENPLLIFYVTGTKK